MAESGIQETVIAVEVGPEAAARVAARYWWVLLVGGILSLAFGIWLVFKPVHAAHTLAVVLGIWLVVVGLVDLVHSGSARNRGASILSGVVLVVLGLVLALKPEFPVKVIAIVWGAAILLGGVVRVVAAIVDRSYGWGWRLLLGAVTAALGLVIVCWPTATIGVVFWITGISAIVTGLVWIATSFSMRGALERVVAGQAGAAF
ncbi:MAG: HdeD family acid-resistance protein [Acidimicrobiia bacterium]